MNKQSVIGFALIGIVLLLFSWYNTKQFEKQQQQRRVQDSIAAVEALKSLPAFDSTASASEIAAEMGAEDSPLYMSEMLNEAYAAKEEFYTLENENLAIEISTLGAQPSKVLVKKYFKYDSTALYLIKDRCSKFDIELDAGQYVNTSDLNYKVVSSSNKELALRLYFKPESYIETLYSLAEDSYTLNTAIHFVGMDELIPRSSSRYKVSWSMNVPRQEKGYENEKNYSSVAYKFKGSSDIKDMSLRKESGHDELVAQTQWFAFKQQFFSSILMSDDAFESGEIAYKVYPENNIGNYLMTAQAVMNVAYGEKSSDFTHNYQMIFVPNHYPTLKGYECDFDKLLPLGGWLIGSINKYVIIPVFNWLSKFISSYGIIILILTLLMKLVISPLTLKSYMSSAKMKVLKPEIDKINARYPKPEDAMKKQQATMDLYKKCDVNMFGGCLPLLLQFPILYAMFRFFPSSFELRQQGFLWASDLSTYDSILNFGFKIPLYGDHVSLFSLLMGISMFFYSKVTLANVDNSQMPGMKFMQLWFMPIFMVVLCNNFSAGLSYYYLLSNLITIIQNWVIRKWFVNEEEIYAKLKEKADSKGPVKKSKFQQRLDEAYRIQQEQQRQQKSKR